MFEAVGAVIVMSMVVRLNRLMDTKVADLLFAGLRIWMIPSRDQIEGAKAPQHKRSKQAPKARTIEDRVNHMGLRQSLLVPGSLARQSLWELLDNICLAVLLAVVSIIWQWVQSMAHPEERLLDMSAWVVFSATCLSLYSLIRLAWKDEFGLSKSERKAFAFALGVLVGAILLGMPSGTTTFSLEQARAQVTQQAQAWRDFVGLKPAIFNFSIDPSGPMLLFLSALCAVLAGVLINPAFLASYTYVHQGGLKKKNPLMHKLLVLEPFLCLYICITFFRPMLLGPLQNHRFFCPCTAAELQGGNAPATCNTALPMQLSHVLPPTEDSWLQYQMLLMMALVGVRAALTRWQIQAHVEYGPIEALYTSYAHKEFEVAPIQHLFQTRLQSMVYVGAMFVAPMAWLSSLLLLLLTKVFMPVWTTQLIRYMAPQANIPGPLALNGTVVEVLSQGNLTMSLGWELLISVVDFPVVSSTCYREVLSFLAFCTVAVWFVCFTVAVLQRLWAMSRINLAAFVAGK